MDCLQNRTASRLKSRSSSPDIDIDLDRLVQERMRTTSFNDCVSRYQEQARAVRRISLEFENPQGPISLERKVERFPFAPSDPAARDERCREAYNIQVQGLRALMQKKASRRPSKSFPRTCSGRRW